MRCGVAAGDLGGPREAALPLGRLLLEDVVEAGLAADDLPGPGDLEALGRALVGLHLRHCWLLLSVAPGSGSRVAGRCRRSSASWTGRPGSVPGLGGRLGRCVPVWLSASAFALSWAALALLVGGQHHRHVAAVELGHGLDLAHVGRPCRPPARGSAGPAPGGASPGPRNMIVTLTLWPSPRNFSTLRVLVSKSPSPILGRYFISLMAIGAALAAGLLGLLRRLVLVLAVVHDPADRRVGHGGHLDEVEVLLPGEGERLRQGLDADLGSVGADQADLPSPDPVVDPGLGVGRRRGYRGLLMSVRRFLLGKRTMGGRREADIRPATPEGRLGLRSTRTHGDLAGWGPCTDAGPASVSRLCA